MDIAIIIVSILLIIIVLLQAGRAEQASLSGGNDSLFKNRKERGGELFITRLTMFLGATFFILCMIQGF